MIQQDIREQLKQATLARETVRLSVLRDLVAKFTNELVVNGRKPTGELSDEECNAIIARAAKQRRDSIEQFQKGGRPDLVANEEAELGVLLGMLPTMMPRAEILKIASAKKLELGITDKSKMGQLIGAVMKEAKGKASGDDVRAVIEEILSEEC